jgi:hypothetical protein
MENSKKFRRKKFSEFSPWSPLWQSRLFASNGVMISGADLTARMDANSLPKLFYSVRRRLLHVKELAKSRRRNVKT